MERWTVYYKTSDGVKRWVLTVGPSARAVRDNLKELMEIAEATITRVKKGWDYPQP